MTTLYETIEITDPLSSDTSLSEKCDQSDDGSDNDADEKEPQPIGMHHSKHWKIRRALIAPFVCFLSIPLIVVLSITRQSRTKLVSTYGCDAGDHVWIDGVRSAKSIWSILHPLNITVSFWKLTLTQARAIDLTWDLIVGRGFQAVAATLVYHGFRLVMADALVDEPLTPNEILAIQYATTSISSCWTYAKGSWQERLGRSRGCFWRFVLLTISVLYVLSLPTWLGATTAYVTRLEPWLSYKNESIWFSDMSPCALSIADGGRIPGLHDDYCVMPHTPLYHGVLHYLKTPSVFQCYPHSNDTTATEVTNAGLTIHYGNANLQRTDSCLLTTYLEWPPGNNFTVRDSVLHLEAGSYSWFNRKTERNHTFPGEYLIENGKCQLQGDLYSWGFSFILLFTFEVTTCILSILWLLVIYRYHSRITPGQTDMVFEDLRAALIVTRAVEDELGRESKSTTEQDQPSALSMPHLRVRGDHVGVNFTAGRPSRTSISFGTIDDGRTAKYETTDSARRVRTKGPRSASPVKLHPNYDLHSEEYEAYLQNQNRYKYTSRGRVLRSERSIQRK